MASYVGAIDQGTTSTRFMIFDHGGNEVARHQLEHQQLMPRPGWVEHSPFEIWERTSSVIRTTLARACLQGSDLAALGITNQRETTVVWNRRTGRPWPRSAWESAPPASSCTEPFRTSTSPRTHSAPRSGAWCSTHPATADPWIFAASGRSSAWAR